MAELAANVLTLAEMAKRLDRGGKVDKIVEILDQWNEVTQDFMVKEANSGSYHKGTTRSGIPQAAWRMLNYGVPNVASKTVQVTDTTGMLEAYAEVDKSLADLGNNANAVRLSETKAIMEGMTQQVAETIFYGNTDVYPDRFLGLSPRYSTRDTAQATSAENVIAFNGSTNSTNCTSIWLIGWGEGGVHGIFPEGSKAGLQHKNLGEVTLLKDGRQYQGYRDHLKWDVGLVVADWRFAVRICNIITTGSGNVNTDDDTLARLIDCMIEAEERIPTFGNGLRFAWYGNRTIRTALRTAIRRGVSNNLTYENIAGKRITAFNEIPFRRVDQLLNTETALVAP